ncbi:MAG TPA: putative quinol monooxygenase [Candidatus Acidoferrum sp.]|jgi:quinol monooxygenase YgiN|nr:putative quinol monooxygenase [Candidatus Acidoferrum sp.]
MLINAVIYTFPPERADEAERLLGELRDASLREEGCLGYEVSRGNDDRSVFVLYEKWRDQAALEAHYAMDHFTRLGINGVRTLMSDRRSVLTSLIP